MCTIAYLPTSLPPSSHSLPPSPLPSLLPPTLSLPLLSPPSSSLSHLAEHPQEPRVQNGVETLHLAAMESQEGPMGRGQLVKPRLLVWLVLQSKHEVWPGVEGLTSKCLLQLAGGEKEREGERERVGGGGGGEAN